MKYFMLTAHQVQKTELTRFVFMKMDWDKLSPDRQIGCVKSLFNSIILSQENNDKLARFVRTVNMPEFNVGTLTIYRVDHGNAVEFALFETAERQPVMVECTKEKYNRFMEDASDEAQK